jgi:hypothetical protein
MEVEDATEIQELEVTQHRPGHLFKPGQSGNPKGRPKGSKNKNKALAEGLIGNNASKIVKKVIEMALAGDQACLKMCMDRIIPAQRAIDIERHERKEQTINITVESMKGLPEIVTKTVEGEFITEVEANG